MTATLTTPSPLFGNTDLFTTYHVELQLRGWICGGIPRDAKTIEGWLRAKAGMTKETEIFQRTMETLQEQGAEVNADMSFEQLVEASKKIAGEIKTNGFKFDDTGLYIEGRQIKAGLKESTNSLFASDRWGATSKGPKSFVAEHVFVRDDVVSLGVTKPTGVLMSIKHIKGPGGPRSALGYCEYVDRPTLAFDVQVSRVAEEVMGQMINGDNRSAESKPGKNATKRRVWEELWVHFQENGLGANRAQGYGKFDVVGITKC